MWRHSIQVRIKRKKKIKAHNGSFVTSSVLTHLHRALALKVLELECSYFWTHHEVCQCFLGEGPLYAQCHFIRALLVMLKAWKWKKESICLSSGVWSIVYLNVSKTGAQQRNVDNLITMIPQFSVSIDLAPFSLIRWLFLLFSFCFFFLPLLYVSRSSSTSSLLNFYVISLTYSPHFPSKQSSF